MKIDKLMQLLRDNASNTAGGVPAKALRAEANAADNCVDIYLYDVIDPYWGASANQLIQALTAAAGQPICLHINSPGGDVFEARAMAAAIAAYPAPVEACIEGICASAATYIALAAGEVCMVEGALLMIHNSWTMAYGDKTALLQTADLLNKIDGTIAADYIRKSGATPEQVTAWMDAETWFTASEALAAKFIDSIEPNTQPRPGQPEPSTDATAARWNLSAYANAPKPAPPAAAPAPDPAALAAQIATQLQSNRNRLRLLVTA